MKQPTQAFDLHFPPENAGHEQSLSDGICHGAWALRVAKFQREGRLFTTDAIGLFGDGQRIEMEV